MTKNSPPPTGNAVLGFHSSPFNRILVCMENGLKTLLFLGDNTHEVQGVMDPAAPFVPLQPYPRAMLCALALASGPGEAFVIGLGAAALQKALWRFFPDVRTTTAEVDEAVVHAALSHFHLELDDRQRVAVEDGRGFLEKASDPERFDVVAVDAFVGSGSVPLPLVTREFFSLCRDRLRPGGALTLNVLNCDERFFDIVKTLGGVFSTVLCIPLELQTIFLAVDRPRPDSERLLDNIRRLEENLEGRFTLLDVAGRLCDAAAFPVHARGLRLAGTLFDADIAPEGA